MTLLSMRFEPRSMRDLEGVYPLAQALAHHLPQADKMLIGIHELLMNAVEHGNLALGFEAKTALLKHGTWHEEMTRRLALPEYAGRAVEITLVKKKAQMALTIADQGEGFAWRDFFSQKQDAACPNGRGLWIALQTPFDDIAFNEAGNVIHCRVATHMAIPRILAKSARLPALLT